MAVVVLPTPPLWLVTVIIIYFVYVKFRVCTYTHRRKCACLSMRIFIYSSTCKYCVCVYSDFWIDENAIGAVQLPPLIHARKRKALLAQPMWNGATVCAATIADLVGPTMPQIVQDRLSDSLREWQSSLTSTFARYDQSSFLPKQITKFQCTNIASAQTQTRDQQQNGPVPRPERRGLIARVDQALNILDREIFGQRGQPPFRDSRNGVFQTRRAITPGNQKAQEHPHSRSQVLPFP